MTTDASPARRGLLRAFGDNVLVRFVLFFVLLTAAYVGVQMGASMLPKQFPAAPAQPLAAAALVLGLGLTLGLYVLLVRCLERRAATEVAFRPVALVVGFAVGLALFCAAYAVFFLLGAAHWGGLSGTTAGVVPALLMAAASGVCEELIFRGGVFRVLEDSLGTLVALILSSALFGGLHAFNPGATLFSDVAIAVEAGLLLGLCYTATRNLWLPIGLHIGWNFTEGGVFGAAVSGNDAKGLIKVPLSGADLITGGKFGPEASIVVVGVCLTLSLIFLILTLKRGQWKPLRARWMLD